MTRPLPLAPTDPVRCEAYACTLSARACALRQRNAGVSLDGKMSADKAVLAMAGLGHSRCTNCADGRAYASAIGADTTTAPRRRGAMPMWAHRQQRPRRAA